MPILLRFWRNQHGSSLESLALVMSVIAVLCVASADFLHYASKKDGVLVRVLASLKIPPAQVGAQDQALREGIDYSPTGTILGLRRAAALSPCMGAAK